VLTWLLVGAVLVAGLGVWLLWRAGVARRTSGLPAGRVTYVDTGAWDRCERTLFSAEHRLAGRPDYLVATRRGIIPVEVKSGAAGPGPYPAHVLQLAAYCLLVEEQVSQRPPYGELLHTLDRMRHDLQAADVGRSHDEPGRCRGCGYRSRCDQSLV